MLLKQKQQLKKAALDNQIKSVNLDIKLLNGISKQTHSLTDTQKNKKSVSLNQLSLILKKKNEKFDKYRHEKQQTREWLKQKGVDFKKLNEQIKQNVRLSEQVPSIVAPKISEPTVLDMRRSQLLKPAQIVEKQFGFTDQNQFEFIQRQKQLVVSKLILKSMGNGKDNKNRNNTRRLLLDRITQGYRNDKQPNSIGQKRSHQQGYSFEKQNKQQNYQRKKRNYFDFAQSLSTKGFQQSIGRLKNIHAVWKIVLQHIKTINHYEPLLKPYKQSNNQQEQFDRVQLKYNSYLMMKSLKLIEKQFQTTLPDHHNFNQIIDDWTRELEKKSRNAKIWRNYNGQPTWAFAFVLFRAGRINQIKRLLQNVDRQFLEDLVRYQQSVDRQSPEPSMKRYDVHKYKDTFYGQLVYILKGTQKFETSIIEQEHLNKTWILLRILGIYRKQQLVQKRYKQILQSMALRQSQLQQCLKKDIILDFIYLGAYKQFINTYEIQQLKHKINNQSYFNNDDYFHLLTVINYFPQLWGNTSIKQLRYLQNKYSQVLIEYLQRLRIQGYNRQIPRYVLLAPQSHIERVACALIKTKKEFQNFDWKELKSLMIQRDQQSGQGLFSYLEKAVLKNIRLSTFQDYRFAAQKYRSIENQKEEIFKQHMCYVQILLQHLYLTEKKKDLLMKNIPLVQYESQLFRFFQISQKDSSSSEIMSKKDRQIKQTISKCEQRLQGQIMKQYENNRFYRKNVIQPYQFYLEYKQLSGLLENPTQNYQRLKQYKPFSQIYYQNRQDSRFYHENIFKPLHNILNFLSKKFQPSTISLYVYYLGLLANRKRLICNYQSDYGGVLDYFKSLQLQLQTLQNHYRKLKQKYVELNERIKNGSRGYELDSQSDDENVLRYDEKTYSNPLDFCQEYQTFASELREYLSQYGAIKTSQNYGRGVRSI